MANSVGMPIPNSAGWPEADLREKPHVEIHSEKAHRCVNHVQAKGHGTSNSWAICTASIGKRGVYARGHGGNAKARGE